MRTDNRPAEAPPASSRYSQGPDAAFVSQKRERTMADPLIGIANHDAVLLRLLAQVLEDAGFRTITLPEGTTAYDEIKRQQPDLVILDTWLESREAGWMLFQVLRLDKETKDIPVLICSSDLEEFQKRASSLEEHTHIGVLNKPYDIDMLVKRVQQMLAGEEIRTSRDGQKPDAES
jgi:DNA-binding response OmpR family regulator